MSIKKKPDGVYELRWREGGRNKVTVQVVGKGRLQKPRRIFTLDLAFG